MNVTEQFSISITDAGGNSRLHQSKFESYDDAVSAGKEAIRRGGSFIVHRAYFAVDDDEEAPGASESAAGTVATDDDGFPVDVNTGGDDVNTHNRPAGKGR